MTHRYLLLATLAILTASGTAAQVTFTSVADGDWSAPGTWDQNAVPTVGSDVVISDNDDVVLDINADVNDLAINEDLLFQATGPVSLTVRGDLTMGANSRFRPLDSTTGGFVRHSLILEGDFTGDGDDIDFRRGSNGSNTSSGVDVTFQGSSNSTVNLALSGSGSAQLLDDFSGIAGAIELNSITFAKSGSGRVVLESSLESSNNSSTGAATCEFNGGLVEVADGQALVCASSASSTVTQNDAGSYVIGTFGRGLGNGGGATSFFPVGDEDRARPVTIESDATGGSTPFLLLTLVNESANALAATFTGDVEKVSELRYYRVQYDDEGTGQAGTLTSLDITYNSDDGVSGGNTDLRVATSSDDGSTWVERDGSGHTTDASGATIESGTTSITLSDEQTLLLSLGNAVGGANTLAASVPPPTSIRISEIDANTDGLGTVGEGDREFIELVGPPNTSLDGLVIVLVDGGDDLPNNDFDLDGFMTDANGIFVIGDEDIVGAGSPTRAQFTGSVGNKLSDGADAILLFVGDGGDFANNQPLDPNDGTVLIDAMIYGNNEGARDTDLQAVVDQYPGFSNTVEHDEDYFDTKEFQGLSRVVVSDSAPFVSDLFYVMDPTPGMPNSATITLNVATTPRSGASALFNPSTAEGDGADWRLLSTPVLDADTEPMAVGDLASKNLIQGVAAGTEFPAEYAGAADNLYPAYLGGDGSDDDDYRGPVDADEELAPGQGFWWYWYDNNLIPSSGGTSRSYELTLDSEGGAYSYVFTGVPVDAAVAEALGKSLLEIPVAVFADDDASRFGLVGNPFAYEYQLGGFSADDGMLSTAFNVWEPGAGYSVVTADVADPFLGGAIGVGEGAFFEVSGVADGATVTLTADDGFVNPVVQGDFNGRLAPDDRLALQLSGEFDSGARTLDRAALVRQVADATDGWDRHDGSKLIPFGSARALLAPVGQRDGEAYRQSVVSLPSLDDVSLPIAFTATGAGTFTLSADQLPGSQAVTLRDEVANTSHDLRAGGYTFAADATDWTDRFTVLIGRNAVSAEPGTEAGAALSLPTPNPARGRASLVLVAAPAEAARVDVVDVLGRTVATLHNGSVPASGRLPLAVDAGRLAPGVYVVRAAVGDRVQTRTLTVVR